MTAKDALGPLERRISSGGDAVAVLTLYLFLLVAVPSRLIVGPLGSAGTPATILGILCLFWWVWARLNRAQTGSVRTQPVRLAMGCFIAVIGIAYVLAMVRAIDPKEISTADSGLLVVAGWFGVLLVANDGIPSSDRLTVLLRRVAFAAGALATLGVAQFITKLPITDYIVIPGLTPNVPLYSVLDRSGFARPAGTALHPIEFGTVLTMILPIALTCAMHDDGRAVVRRWFPVLMIAIAIPLSISRSSLVGAAIGLLILLPTWSRSARIAATGFIAVLLLGVFLTVPGMLGVLGGLFTGIGQDSSAQSRTGSYDIAWEFIQRSPLLGRGFGTFLPVYRIFDNQYLGMLVEIGIVGVLAFVGLLGASIACSRQARRLSTDPQVRQQAQSLVASTVVAGAVMSLFDAFSFPMFTGMVFLILGMSGAIWRLVREADELPLEPAFPVHAATSTPPAKIRTFKPTRRVAGLPAAHLRANQSQ